MGSDKSLLPIANHSSLVQYQYERFLPYFTNVYISSKSNKFDFVAPFIYDQNETSSPMVALNQIFQTISEEKCFILAVDIPLINIQTITSLIQHSKNYDICLAADDNHIHYLCGVYSKSLLSKTSTLLKQDIHQIKKLFETASVGLLKGFSEDIFFNMNNQDEYKFIVETLSKS